MPMTIRAKPSRGPNAFATPSDLSKMGGNPNFGQVKAFPELGSLRDPTINTSTTRANKAYRGKRISLVGKQR